jgi:hypothetical protein
MSVRERIAMAEPPFAHVCQFFDSSESRTEVVARFLDEGLRRGDAALVIARPLHWAAISTRLESEGVSIAAELERGRLIVKDATDTLRRICHTGAPTRAAFQQVLGDTLRQCLDRGRLCAYGEMVDLLAERGELRETLALEDLWNRSGADDRLTLFCGYSSPHFVSAATHKAMCGICAAHRDIWRSDDDPLADWLLTASHHPITGPSSLSH